MGNKTILYLVLLIPLFIISCYMVNAKRLRHAAQEANFLNKTESYCTEQFLILGGGDVICVEVTRALDKNEYTAYADGHSVTVTNINKSYAVGKWAKVRWGNFIKGFVEGGEDRHD